MPPIIRTNGVIRVPSAKVDAVEIQFAAGKVAEVSIVTSIDDEHTIVEVYFSEADAHVPTIRPRSVFKILTKKTLEC